MLVSNYDHQVVTLLSTYNVTFEVGSYIFQDLEVTVSPRTDVLLGRDILNHFVLTLNGEDLIFDFQDP